MSLFSLAEIERRVALGMSRIGSKFGWKLSFGCCIIMASSPAPRNRKERRAQAKEKGDDISFSQPSRDAPTHKTLLDIAAERQLINSPRSNANPSIATTKINPDGTLSGPSPVSEDEEPSDPELSTWIDIVMYTFTLTLLHFTFTFLVNHQYAMEPPSIPSLIYRSTIATPTPALLFILVAILHPRSSHWATQLLFVAMSLVAGAWLVHTSNEDAYLATMQKTPPLGTLWVWATLELKWEMAATCVTLVAGWGWWSGYTIF